MSKRCGRCFSPALLHPCYWTGWLSLGLMFMSSLLPTGIRHFIGDLLGSLIYRNNSKRRNIVKTNLELAYPDYSESRLDAMTRSSLQWYARALIDYSLFMFGSKKRLVNMLAIDGKEHIDKALEQNRNIIIFLAHSVMLEFASAALSLSHYDCYCFYKTAKNPVFDWMIVRSRCRYLKFAVSRREGVRKLVKSLIPGRIMFFLPDEDLGEKNAVFAPFFGIQKATLTTPARLARLGNASCLPGFVWYDANSRKYRLQIAPPLGTAEQVYPTKDPVENARVLNVALESLIRQHPEQYMWMLRLFRTRPEGEQAIYLSEPLIE